jgi:hypothetical protein
MAGSVEKDLHVTISSYDDLNLKGTCDSMLGVMYGDIDKKMNWAEMVQKFPDQWVALADYEEKDSIEIKGIVVAHGPDRKIFHERVRKLLPEYEDLAIRYTGELIKNAEIPLLWQITHTA